MGELAGSTLKMDMLENINTADRVVREAREYIWMGGIEQPINYDSILVELVPKGVKGRFLFMERFLPKKQLAPELARGIEYRIVDSFPITFLMTEKEGVVAFSQVGGKADYAAFMGQDPVLLTWCRDFFLYYWDQGRRV